MVTCNPVFVAEILAIFLAQGHHVVGATGFCPNGWLAFVDSCYWFRTDLLTWYDYVEYCRNASAYTVTIETAAENAYLQQKVNEKGGHYWIGLNDIANEGTYVWNRTGQVATYTSWTRYGPSGGAQDCVHFFAVFQGWNDHTCSATHYYICEQGKGCGSPDTPDHGGVEVSGGTLVGASVKYTCNVGYILEGNATRTCASNFTWTGTTPTCKLDCGAPPSLEHGTVVTSDGTTFGKSANYTCNEGYDLVGDATRTCTQDRTWTGTAPTCEPKNCGAPPSLEHGTVVTSDGTTFGKSASYTCNEGYDLVGDATRTCAQDRTWTGTAPTCEPKNCGAPPSLEHGTVVTSDGTTFGKSANYICNEGYDLVGDATRTCAQDRTWTGTVPTCEPKNCGAPPSPEHGTVVTSDGTTFGKSANYTCNEGYDLVGDATRTCTQDRTWTGTAPTCEPKNCGAPPSLEHGTVVTSDGTTFGKSANYTCNEGYDLVGDATRTCAQDRTWTGTVPTCEPKNCGVPPSPEHGTVVTSDGTTFGKSANYTCNEGYDLVGDATRTCAQDRTWTGTAPTCEPKNCGAPPSLEHGTVVTSDGTTFGKSANYTCNEGYDLVGDATRMCAENGTWTGTTPTCNTKSAATMSKPYFSGAFLLVLHLVLAGF